MGRVYPTDVTARASKNGRPQVNPLPESTAVELRAVMTGRNPHGPVWPGRWSFRAAVMLRADLTDTGIAWKAADAHGPVYGDFHGFRHPALTHPARSAPLHVVQKLAGHSSPTVTPGTPTRTRPIYGPP